MRNSECGVRSEIAGCGVKWPSQPCSAFRTPHSAFGMVGSAGNAPVVASSLFEDTGFTDRQPDHFPLKLFQQRTNTSCYLAIPTHGFTVVLSVFGGTPPAKPLNCKIRFAVSGQEILRAWARHAGDDSKFVLAKFNLSPEDITRMSCYSCSQIANLSLTAIHTVSSAGE